MPEQNPLTRIDAVARGLGELARDLGEQLGPEAPRTLLYWRRELNEALEALAHVRPPES